MEKFYSCIKNFFIHAAWLVCIKKLAEKHSLFKEQPQSYGPKILVVESLHMHFIKVIKPPYRNTGTCK